LRVQAAITAVREERKHPERIKRLTWTRTDAPNVPYYLNPDASPPHRTPAPCPRCPALPSRVGRPSPQASRCPAAGCGKRLTPSEVRAHFTSCRKRPKKLHLPRVERPAIHGVSAIIANNRTASAGVSRACTHRMRNTRCSGPDRRSTKGWCPSFPRCR
jgi:hypothetical protein